MTKYITYYRVSTQRQGNSGLGLEAQRSAVGRFTNNCPDCILAEFTDVESGKNNNRPELLKAIAEAKRTNTKLLIAKLDRLSRNAAFIFTLRDSQVDFICCDMPDANSVTIGIMAVLAQDERERISQRTKHALTELKKRGVQLGTPDNLTQQARENSLRIRQVNAHNNENNRKAGALVVAMRQQGKRFREITDELNRLGFKARKGGQLQITQVQRLFERYSENLEKQA